jgi:hypothetical protein
MHLAALLYAFSSHTSLNVFGNPPESWHSPPLRLYRKKLRSCLEHGDHIISCNTSFIPYVPLIWRPPIAIQKFSLLASYAGPGICFHSTVASCIWCMKLCQQNGRHGRRKRGKQGILCKIAWEIAVSRRHHHMNLGLISSRRYYGVRKHWYGKVWYGGYVLLSDVPVTTKI